MQPGLALSAPQARAKGGTKAGEGETLHAFPTGSLAFGTREEAFRAVALAKGHPWSVDEMANAFRSGFADVGRLRSDVEWLRIWEAFVIRYAERRANRPEG